MKFLATPKLWKIRGGAYNSEWNSERREVERAKARHK